MYKSMTTNLMVESVKRSIAFYKDILGFSVTVTAPGENNDIIFAILSKDGLLLMLQEKNSLASEYPELGTDRIKPSITLYCTVEDLDALHEEIKAKYPIYKGPYITFYGSKEFAILDPDGYALTFAKHGEMQ